VTDQPEQPAQSDDETRDWAAEEAEALRIEREREAKLLREQRGRE
jgi:hypothetical protein